MAYRCKRDALPTELSALPRETALFQGFLSRSSRCSRNGAETKGSFGTYESQTIHEVLPVFHYPDGRRVVPLLWRPTQLIACSVKMAEMLAVRFCSCDNRPDFAPSHLPHRENLKEAF